MSSVGFDLSAVFGHGGIPTYAKELVSHMARVTERPELVLLTRKGRTERIEELTGGHPSVQVHAAMPHPLMLGRSLSRVTDAYKTQVWKKYTSAIDLVHFHESGLYRPVETRSVVTVHDLFPMDPEIPAPTYIRKAFERQLELSVNYADRILVPSAYVASTIATNYPQISDRVRVTHLAASDRFVPSELARPYTEPYLLWIGRLDARKNLERILTAWSQLPPSLTSSSRFVLIGPWNTSKLGAEHRTLEPLLDGPNITVRSKLTDDEHRQLLTHAHGLVFASLAEGFGLPIVEAMKCTCPVLTSNTSSMPEIAGDAAMLVDPLSISEIREGIERLLSDAALRDDLRQAGLERVKLFSWAQTVQKTLAVYNEVLE